MTTAALQTAATKSILVIEPQPWYGAELSRQFAGRSVCVHCHCQPEQAGPLQQYQLILVAAPVEITSEFVHDVLQQSCLLVLIFDSLTDSARLKWLQVGVTAVLQRPVSCRELKQTVQQLLDIA